jgi:hypothetical protein
LVAVLLIFSFPSSLFQATAILNQKKTAGPEDERLNQTTEETSCEIMEQSGNKNTYFRSI